MCDFMHSVTKAEVRRPGGGESMAAQMPSYAPCMEYHSFALSYPFPITPPDRYAA